MAIIKAVKNSHSSIKQIVDYVTKKEKTIGRKLCAGHNCHIDTAILEMQTTKELYGKTGGRTYKHFVQSFPPGENLTPEQAHKIAKEFVASCPLFADYEVVYATHVDREHLHTHIVLNSVSFTNGHKFQMSKKDLTDMKQLNNQICMEHDLAVCEIGKKKSDRKDIIAYDMNKYQFLKKAKEGKVKSYVQDTAVAVYDAMEKSKSKEEFISEMNNKGYSVVWNDRRKYIVFTNPDGKKVRNNNLQKTYHLDVGKDELLELFKNNAIEKKKSQPARHRKR